MIDSSLINIDINVWNEIFLNLMKFLSFLALIISVICVFLSIKNPLSKALDALNNSFLTIIALILSMLIISLILRFI